MGAVGSAMGSIGPVSYTHLEAGLWYPYGYHHLRRIQDVYRQTEIHSGGGEAEGGSP